MRTIGSTQYAVAMTTLAVLVATTTTTIWKYFAVLAVLVTGWFVYSLAKARKNR